MQIKKELNC